MTYARYGRSHGTLERKINLNWLFIHKIYRLNAPIKEAILHVESSNVVQPLTGKMESQRSNKVAEEDPGRKPLENRNFDDLQT